MKILAFSLVFAACGASAQSNPFQPPRATVHYAPDHLCDLLNVTVDLDVDYDHQSIKGHVVDTFSPLSEGVREIHLQAGKALVNKSVVLDGQAASYRRDGEELTVDAPGLKKGKAVRLELSYVGDNLHGNAFGGGGGFHWIMPGQRGSSDRVGFWTQGETEFNRQWCPTWDHPNDFTTSETRTTVPANWNVIGNGVLVSNALTADKKHRTFVWRMTQPHATYLLSVCGGPFDIKKDKWEGVDLWYVVPKGEGKYIDDSFGDTKNMLSFYSTTLGVKYAWPKYAQDAMYDFGGGMENVSATTLGEPSLTEKRDGFYNMASLNAHELAHQWFGDLVTCQDWGDTWLNESFATFMEALYMGHAGGKNAYDQEIGGDMSGYISSSRAYKRAISTRLYPNADAMFDSTAYPKGASVLHTLRRQLGDAGFFGGLNLYLTRHRHQPVQSAQLSRALTDYTGINCDRFFDQWVYKPGHPVLDYTWKVDANNLLLTVQQLQDTSDGTPIYDIPTSVTLISPTGVVTKRPIHLTKALETFTVPFGAGMGAVILDADHDFLREVKTLHWADADLPIILKWAPNSLDRAQALRQMLGVEKPASESVQAVVEVLRKDDGLFPAFRYVGQLAELDRPDLRTFWLEQTHHTNLFRRSQAVGALGRLPKDAATVQRLRSMINDQEGIDAVTKAIAALAGWDAKGNVDVFRKAQKIQDRRGRIRRAADDALESAGEKA